MKLNLVTIWHPGTIKRFPSFRAWLNVRGKYMAHRAYWKLKKFNPRWPIWFAKIAVRRGWVDLKYVHITRKQIAWWDSLGRAHPYKPNPWWWGDGNGFQGPFVAPWQRFCERIGRLQRPYSHRCEFTDPEIGALWGGRDGAFMNVYFDTFTERISGGGEDA